MRDERWATGRACRMFQRRVPSSQHGTLARPKGTLLHKRTGPEAEKTRFAAALVEERVSLDDPGPSADREGRPWQTPSQLRSETARLSSAGHEIRPSGRR